MEKLLKRRKLIQSTLGLTGAYVASRAMVTQALAGDVCQETPAQPEGPFYPVQDQMDKDVDLTRVKGRSKEARGQKVRIQGKVLDEVCAPVAGALVEIWQACETGRYNHPSDPNTSVALDPDFQYWGQALTDSEGRYSFKTIIPGAYPASSTWMRPAHIHFKASKLGFLELITQMYFEGERFNDKDLILQRLSKAEQKKVVVSLSEPPASEPGVKQCQFDLTLMRP